MQPLFAICWNESGRYGHAMARSHLLPHSYAAPSLVRRCAAQSRRTVLAPDLLPRQANRGLTKLHRVLLTGGVIRGFVWVSCLSVPSWRSSTAPSSTSPCRKSASICSNHAGSNGSSHHTYWLVASACLLPAGWRTGRDANRSSLSVWACSRSVPCSRPCRRICRR
jgi:hypothetical protein